MRERTRLAGDVFALTIAIGQHLVREGDRVAEHLDLTPPQWLLLAVLDRGLGAEARMQARVLSVVTMVDVSGPGAVQAETVTLLNDLVVFAAPALIDAPIRWAPIDDRHVVATSTKAGHTISAQLAVDDAGQLVDFAIDDRSAASRDGSSFTPRRWSTPITAYRAVGPRRIAAAGTGRWHPEDGPAFDYLNLRVDEITHLTPPGTSKTGR